MPRRCSHPECTYQVPHSDKESGYCDKKYGAHWNEPVAVWNRPKCECGADSTKSARTPHPKHSTWCKVYAWETEPGWSAYSDYKD